MIAFWLYWFPAFIGILSFLFCKFCLIKYDWSKHTYLPFKIKLWIFLLFILWCFTPLLNWTDWMIILICIVHGGYSVKESFTKSLSNNFILKFLNKDI